jgi:O-antigen/teichoic acid export membrane protein
VTAILSFVTVSITARSLGPALFGVMALIEVYGRTIERFVRFESWQAVVRYGADALESDDGDRLRQLLKASTLFDVAGATLAALIAMLAIGWVGPWLNLSDPQISLARLFSFTLVFSLSSTPVAILRLFDRFDLLAKISVGSAVLRLGLTALAWALGGQLIHYVWVLIIYQLADGILKFTLAWREVYRKGYRRAWAVPLDGFFDTFDKIVGFVFYSNAAVMARTSTLLLDTLLVGLLLNPAAVGFYQVAQRTGRLLVRLSGPLRQAVFPDIARLWARGEVAKFRSIVLAVNLGIGVSCAVGLIAVSFVLEPIVIFAFGPQYAEVSPLILIQLGAATIFLAGTALNPALLSMGYAQRLAGVTVAASVLFFASLFPLVRAFGLTGALMAHVIFNLVWLVGCYWLFGSRLRDQAKPHGEHVAGSADQG